MVNQSLPFAMAMLDIAQESAKEELFLDQLDQMAQIYAQNPDLVKVMDHPQIGKDEKLSMLRSLFEKDTDPVIMDFLQVLCGHRMAGRIPEIFEEYQELYDKAHDIETVEVTSAADLSEEQQARLIAALEKKLGKKIKLTVKSDPALIAGMKIKTASHTLDGSYAGRLAAMKEQLLKS